MKGHEEISESLVDFVLGQLSEEQELAVKTHLSQCQQCKCELRRLKALLEHTEQIRRSCASPEIFRSAKQAILAAVEAEQAKPTTEPSVRLEFVWRTIVKSRITKLAAAAVIIIAISFLVVRFGPNKPSDTVKIAQVGKSPAELTTFGTLIFAYRRGGMKMVEQMCDKALTMAGPRPAGISVQDLLENYNGKNPERTEL